MEKLRQRGSLNKWLLIIFLVYLLSTSVINGLNDEDRDSREDSIKSVVLDEEDSVGRRFLEGESDPPSEAPSISPSTTPSTSPSDAPTDAPSDAPSEAPSVTPSESPSRSPTDSPSDAPTDAPSDAPSEAPSATPSESPSRSPTDSPSDAPSTSPSGTPTTSRPSKSPSKSPSTSPSRSPSGTPTTSRPSAAPSKSPITSGPSTSPTTSKPSKSPSASPTTSKPSKSPSSSPTTSRPSKSPSEAPTTSKPTTSPSQSPTTSAPSKSPTTSAPTKSPTRSPSRSPTESPVPFREQNVVLIIVDDLKGAVASFGDADAKTPNLDRLGQKGMRFTNHHVQVSECAPSRLVLFTGRRPDMLEIFGREPYFRYKNRHVMTIPAYFRGLNYVSVGLGKTYDPSSFSNSKDYNFENVETCSPSESPGADTCTFDINSPAGVAGRNYSVCPLGGNEYPPSTSAQPLYLTYGDQLAPEDPSNEGFYDNCIANHAIAHIRDYELTNQPFFLTVGFLRPHLPWSAPRKYWDMYPRSKEKAFAKKIHAKDVSGKFFRKSSGAQSRRVRWDEPSSYRNQPGKQRRASAYYASVAFIDEQIGRVVTAVEQSPSKHLRENTLIVVWGDNGFHLGPLLWGKKTVFEQATRTPLIVVPSIAWRRAQTKPVTGIGKAIAFPSETIDIYPTIIELANVPEVPFRSELPGVSLVPYFFNQGTRLKEFAVSQYRDQRKQFYTRRMGYSIRGDNYRLIQYFDFDPRCWRLGEKCVFFGKLSKRQKSELYYYAKPGAKESQNLFNKKTHKLVKLQMLEFMKRKSKTWLGPDEPDSE